MSVIELVRMLDQVEPPLRSILLGILEEMERQQRDRVTKNEFNELREVVRELAEAQKGSEERLGRLEDMVRELAEAQMRTEKTGGGACRGPNENRKRSRQLGQTGGGPFGCRGIRHRRQTHAPYSSVCEKSLWH